MHRHKYTYNNGTITEDIIAVKNALKKAVPVYSADAVVIPPCAAIAVVITGRSNCPYSDKSLTVFDPNAIKELAGPNKMIPIESVFTYRMMPWFFTGNCAATEVNSTAHNTCIHIFAASINSG